MLKKAYRLGTKQICKQTGGVMKSLNAGFYHKRFFINRGKRGKRSGVRLMGCAWPQLKDLEHFLILNNARIRGC